MPSLIGNMLATYGTPMQEFAMGVQVQIQRGVSVGAAVTGIVEVVENKITDEAGGVTEVIESRNYEIAVTNYTVNGTAAGPRAGDTIHETVNGIACRFKAMPVAKMPAFEYADSDRVRWLIRTKLVEEAAA